jgi:hypothetical protein
MPTNAPSEYDSTVAQFVNGLRRGGNCSWMTKKWRGDSHRQGDPRRFTSGSGQNTERFAPYAFVGYPHLVNATGIETDNGVNQFKGRGNGVKPNSGAHRSTMAQMRAPFWAKEIP